MLGLSRELLKAAKKALKESGNFNPSFEQVHQCYRDIRDDVEQARRSQKIRTRRAVARAKLDKDGWKIRAAKPQIVSAEMDWLDKPITTGIATPFKVTYRRPDTGSKS